MYELIISLMDSSDLRKPNGLESDTEKANKKSSNNDRKSPPSFTNAMQNDVSSICNEDDEDERHVRENIIQELKEQLIKQRYTNDLLYLFGSKISKNTKKTSGSKTEYIEEDKSIDMQDNYFDILESEVAEENPHEELENEINYFDTFDDNENICTTDTEFIGLNTKNSHIDVAKNLKIKQKDVIENAKNLDKNKSESVVLNNTTNIANEVKSSSNNSIQDLIGFSEESEISYSLFNDNADYKSKSDDESFHSNINNEINLTKQTSSLIKNHNETRYYDQMDYEEVLEENITESLNKSDSNNPSKCIIIEERPMNTGLIAKESDSDAILCKSNNSKILNSHERKETEGDKLISTNHTDELISKCDTEGKENTRQAKRIEKSDDKKSNINNDIGSKIKIMNKDEWTKDKYIERVSDCNLLKTQDKDAIGTLNKGKKCIENKRESILDESVAIVADNSRPNNADNILNEFYNRSLQVDISLKDNETNLRDHVASNQISSKERKSITFDKNDVMENDERFDSIDACGDIEKHANNNFVSNSLVNHDGKKDKYLDDVSECKDMNSIKTIDKHMKNALLSNKKGREKTPNNHIDSSITWGKNKTERRDHNKEYNERNNKYTKEDETEFLNLEQDHKKEVVDTTGTKVSENPEKMDQLNTNSGSLEYKDSRNLIAKKDYNMLYDIGGNRVETNNRNFGDKNHATLYEAKSLVDSYDLSISQGEVLERSIIDNESNTKDKNAIESKENTELLCKQNDEYEKTKGETATPLHFDENTKSEIETDKNSNKRSNPPPVNDSYFIGIVIKYKLNIIDKMNSILDNKHMHRKITVYRKLEAEMKNMVSVDFLIFVYNLDKEQLRGITKIQRLWRRAIIKGIMKKIITANNEIKAKSRLCSQTTIYKGKNSLQTRVRPKYNSDTKFLQNK